MCPCDPPGTPSIGQGYEELGIEFGNFSSLGAHSDLTYLPSPVPLPSSHQEEAEALLINRPGNFGPVLAVMWI